MSENPIIQILGGSFDPLNGEITFDGGKKIMVVPNGVEVVTGPPGLSAYDLAIEDGSFSGTKEQYSVATEAARIVAQEHANAAELAKNTAESSANDATDAKETAQQSANEAAEARDAAIIEFDDLFPDFDTRITTIENLGLVKDSVEVGGLNEDFDQLTYRSSITGNQIFVYNDPFDADGLGFEIEVDIKNAGEFNAYIYNRSENNVFSIAKKLTFTAVSGRNYFAISTYVKAGQYFGVSGKNTIYLVNGLYAPLLYQFTGEGNQADKTPSLNVKIPAKIKIQKYKNALVETVASLQTIISNQATTLTANSLQLNQLSAAITELQSGTGTTGVETGTDISPWRIVNQRSHINRASEGRTGADKYVLEFERKIGGGAVRELSAAFDTAYITSGSTGLLTNLGNDLIFDEVAIEHAGISVPLTKDGSRSFTIPDGTFDFRLDSLLPADFGLTTFNHGLIFQIKAKISLFSGDKVPFGNTDIRSMNRGKVAFYNSAETTVSDVDTLGAFTSSGVALHARNSGLEARLIGKYVNDETATVIGGRGDSITAGTGDTGVSDPNGMGWLNRMCTSRFTQAPALFNMAVHGSSSQSAINDTRFTPIYSMITDGVVCFGANDIGVSGLGDYGGLFSRTNTIAGQMKELGVRTVGVMELLPRTNSTDLWATKEGQSYAGQWQSGGNPDLYNQSLPQANVDYVMKNDSVSDPTDPWLIRTDGTARSFSWDGTHFSTGGYDLMADESAQDCAAAIPNLTAA